MNTENYLNHPTFGLFYRVCLLEEHQEVFSTLCAAPIFLVTTGTTGLKFEPISRSEVRLLLEHRACSVAPVNRRITISFRPILQRLFQ